MNYLQNLKQLCLVFPGPALSIAMDAGTDTGIPISPQLAPSGLRRNQETSPWALGHSL